MENGLLGFAGQGHPVDLDPNTQLFTSSGIWTKPADCQWVRVILVGGGGGGAGGRRHNTFRPAGGSGGGGGGMSFLDVPATYLPNTVTVTIGAGGAGGNGSTTANTNGSNGSSGGSSSFGTYLSAEGGGSGTSSDNAGGGSGGRAHMQGGNGGAVSFSNPQQVSRLFGTSGGGGGGSQTDQHLVVNPTCGSTALSPFLEPMKYGLLGTGGMGGAINLLGTVVNNSSAGTFGNGGGGGGAGKQNNNAGNGSAGGDGYCLIVSYGTAYKPVNVQEFTTTGTWTKPTDPRLTTARVFAIGAGGGGGSGRRWDRTKGAYLTGSYLALSQVSGCYASVPDNAALDITGDIDIQVKVALFNWSNGPTIVDAGTSGRDRCLLGKINTTGNQRSYWVNFDTLGRLTFNWTTDGTIVQTATATDTVNLDRYAVKWLRATMDVDNGAGGKSTKFYTSDDGTTWTQLGTTVTSSGTTSIYSGTSIVNIPGAQTGTANLMEGYFYRAIIRNGYDGAGSTVLDANFETAAAGAASFTESSSNAFTVTINNASTNLFGGGGGRGGLVSYSEIPLAFLPSTVDVSVGIGGTGGAGVTTDYTNGNYGTYGGNSSFGTYLFAQGGENGYGGSSGTGSSGAGAGSSRNYVIGHISAGGSGGAGGSTTGNSPDLGVIAQGSFMTIGGGGGGGINTTGTTGAGGSSSAGLGYGSSLPSTTAAQNGTELFPSGTGMFGSTGGGGGSSNGTVTAGNGGRGSGGGGGAATANGTTSGAGGNGGDGYVLVVCV